VKKYTLALVIALLLVSATAVWAASVIPTVITGASNLNKTCAVVMPGTTELKQDDTNGSGPFYPSDGTLSVTITKPSAGTPTNLNSFDWTSNIAVVGVIVKDGVDGANWYDYSPAGSKGDTYLTTPNDGAKGISHISFCYYPSTDYEELTVSKTAKTSYIRTHKWSIDKSVKSEHGYEHEGYPKIWLYIDGSGNEKATWTVDVGYKGFDDSDFKVYGVITIKNTGTLDAVITDVSDVLLGTGISVDCGVGFPYTLGVGGELTCSYAENVSSKISGKNVVDVMTERDTYSAEAAVIWGEPTSQVNATVTIKDVSDLFGVKTLGTFTAPNGGQFTYSKEFAWAGYGQDKCGDYVYKNTASIVETGQSASATLKVNVQCYIYETAFAKGCGAKCFINNGFDNWGWTNPIGPGTYTWPLWAGAGQCDTSKGTLVGTVTVKYVGGYVTVTYNVSAPYLLDETHVYAGYGMFPKTKKGKLTVAPGQYYNDGPFDGRDVYVIAHAVVGIPDPNFGP